MDAGSRGHCHNPQRTLSLADCSRSQPRTEQQRTKQSKKSSQNQLGISLVQFYPSGSSKASPNPSTDLIKVASVQQHPCSPAAGLTESVGGGELFSTVHLGLFDLHKKKQISVFFSSPHFPYRNKTQSSNMLWGSTVFHSPNLPYSYSYSPIPIPIPLEYGRFGECCIYDL